MQADADLEEDIEYIRGCVLRKFPLLGVTMAGMPTQLVSANERIKTAATDSKIIYVAPDFWNKLNDDEKIFIYAHELMHVAFNHILRSKNRDQELWNQATDAVINQILKNEDLPLVKDGVDMPEALNHSAEEMYDKLLKEQKENQKTQSSSQQSGEGQEGQKGQKGQKGQENQQGHDNHEIWQDAVAQAEKEQQQQEAKKSVWEKIKEKFNKTQQVGEDKNSEFEKSFAQSNRQERLVQAQNLRQKLQQHKNEVMAAKLQEETRSYGDVGEAEAAADWRKLLKKSILEEETRWSYRRSGASNDYMARAEELEDENKSTTEVMLDVSGSVDEELLKEFLRQLKPILKNSELKVGCFDEYFYGLREIKKPKDIDNFRITARSQWTENWDLAVRSFSKNRDVNKIVFTDGYPCPGTMPANDLKNVKVIWLVYGNKDFRPCCGKVIQVDRSQIRQRLIATGRGQSSR